MCCDRLAAYYRFHTGHTYCPPHSLLCQQPGAVYKSESSTVVWRPLGGQLSGLRPIEGLPVLGMRQVLHSRASTISAQLCTICAQNCARFVLNCAVDAASHSHSHSLIQSRSQYE